MRIHLIPTLLIFACWAPAKADTPESKPEKSPASATENMDDLWRDLADPHAAKAYRAIWILTKTPKETVAYIGLGLEPAAAPDPKKVERWIEELSSETFAVREKANMELTKLGDLVEPALRNALKTNPALEASRRIEKLLNRLLAPITNADQLRAVRAVETLEYIGTPEAKALLAKYAAGAAGARLTEDSKDAIDRLAKTEPLPVRPNPSGTDLYGDPLPAGAVGRLGTIRFRRPGDGGAPVGDEMAFLPGGKTLITYPFTRPGVIAKDHEVWVWEMSSGRLLHTLSTAPFVITALALAPDGKRFAAAGYEPPLTRIKSGSREIRLFSIPSGNLVKTLAYESAGDEWRLAFSPDGKLLFSLNNVRSGGKGVLRIEEVATGKKLSERKFPSGVGAGMALSSDGKYLAVNSGVNTGKLFLWKWQEEEPRQLETNLNGRGLDGMGFSADGKLLAGVQAFKSLYVWEVSSGGLLYQMQPAEKDAYFTGQPTFTPDGKTLVSAQRSRDPGRRLSIAFLDPATGRSQWVSSKVAGNRIGMVVSADSRTLAVATGLGVRFLDLTSRSEGYL